MTKQEVHTAVVEEIQHRLQRLNQTLSETTISMQNETKSSAGDKHETARAMAQLEQEKLGQQIHVTQTLYGILDQLNPSDTHETIQFGSLVQLDDQWYYFSTGIGKIRVGEETVFCLSIVTPLGKIVSGKKVGDHVEFNGKQQRITTVV